MNLDTVVGLYNYWIVIFLMMTGFYMVIARRNLIKAVIGLNIFQTSVFLLYITMGKVAGGTAPIIPPDVAKAQAHDDAAEGGHQETHGADHAATSPGSKSDVSATGVELDGTSGGGAGNAEANDQVLGLGEMIAEAETAVMNGEAAEIIYSSPLPSVLMLTAIVVGIATTALALALIVRIREDYGTVEEDEILILDRQS